MSSEESWFMQSVDRAGDGRVYQSKLVLLGEGQVVYENISHLLSQYSFYIPRSILTQFVVFLHQAKQPCKLYPLTTFKRPVPPHHLFYIVFMAPNPFFHKEL